MSFSEFGEFFEFSESWQKPKLVWLPGVLCISPYRYIPVKAIKVHFHLLPPGSIYHHLHWIDIHPDVVIISFLLQHPGMYLLSDLGYPRQPYHFWIRHDSLNSTKDSSGKPSWICLWNDHGSKDHVSRIWQMKIMMLQFYLIVSIFHISSVTYHSFPFVHRKYKSRNLPDKF